MSQRSNFVHLHNHSDYSLLDGASKLELLVEAASAMGMPALAVTDHGNVFGAIQFYTHSIPESSLLEAVSAPFYREIHESVRREHGRCLAIREPQAILDLVNRHGARDSNGDSRRSLEAWARRPGAGAPGRAKGVPAW